MKRKTPDEPRHRAREHLKRILRSTALTGAKLVAVKRADSTLTFSAIPRRGITSVEVVVQVDCAGKPAALRLGLDVTHPVVDGSVDISSLE